MSNNFIRVLRNTDLCATREAAIEKLQGKLATLQDGEICIASYGANWGEAKTILGVVRVKTVDSVVKRSYTIFDNENTAAILAKIQELNATKDETDTDGHVTVKVVQEAGLLKTLEVKTSDIASAASLGTKDDASTVDTAFGRIAKEVKDRDTAITNAINALTKTVSATGVDGNQYSVLTGVTQTNGKLASVAEVKLAAVAKTGLASDVATTNITGDDTHVAVTGANVSAQITDIAKTLKGITDTQANPVKYKTVQVSDVSALGANVKEAYQVVSYTGEWVDGTTIGTPVGEVIKIYKDASIHKIYLGSEADTINETSGEITTVTPTETNLTLNYAYMKADGTYEMAKINVANFLRESEFKDGLQVNSGVVSVKKDSTSEKFLTVGKDGIKLSGVQTAIDTAIGKLDADVISTGDSNVTVKVTEVDGKVNGVTVTTPGLALDSQVIKGVTVNGADAQVSADRKAIVTINGANTAVSDAYVTTKYAEPFETKVGADNHIKANDKIDAAFKKTENTISVLANEVISNEKVTTTAVSKLAESVGGVTNTDGVIKYTPKEGANYISGATSVHDATVKLDAAIKTVETNALTGVTGSEAITVSDGKTVSLKLGTGSKGDNALVINTNGLYLPNVWDCGVY